MDTGRSNVLVPIHLQTLHKHTTLSEDIALVVQPPQERFLSLSFSVKIDKLPWLLAD